MKNLYEPAAVQEVKQRLDQLEPARPPLWGKMNSAQMMAHIAEQFEMVMGRAFPPRSLAGRVFGRFAKPITVNEKPFPRSTPTDKALVISDDRDFETERKRLSNSIDEFSSAGPAGCTKHPHSFFGHLTAQEWSRLMYKHLDHHLRQFGV
jgi:Protein of unknown function (DUF1569)